MNTNFMLTCLENRIDEVNDGVIAQDHEYQEVCKKIGQVYQMILNDLPNKNLIKIYDELTGERDCICQTIVYKQGVKDGKILATIKRQQSDKAL